MKTVKIAALVLLVSIVSAFTLVKSDLGGYQIGDVATDFSLQNVDTKKVSLSDFKDAKGFIVVFTCNHCPYAKAYEERIMALDKKYKKLGYPVVAINPNNPAVQPDDSFEMMQKRAKEKGYTFPYLFDEGQKIYPQYGATKTPHVYILEKTKAGNVVRYIGAIDDNYSDEAAVKTKYVENAVDALLKNQDVPVKTTKAIGCSIKA
ncbi:thiol-disulfide isomerase or thioredoxin [Flavobacterium enshiense DK69]|uniref:Redoxin n=1 Tax=Flavobacterium enshiense DK69 TaxID=1107311 RepID=V6SG23_9FLAO|nr:thioredoxin family protein [Flavobacterium enshiense]ESU25192.1 thiol-disulfide isomerase or thioredoxin [Flavobacterium enshiense DK69]KGO96913.1 redoxin [Flavobacterium enshiense DK69]